MTWRDDTPEGKLDLLVSRRLPDDLDHPAVRRHASRPPPGTRSTTCPPPTCTRSCTPSPRRSTRRGRPRATSTPSTCHRPRVLGQAKTHLGTRRDLVSVPLLHDTPGQTAQPGGVVRDWRRGDVPADPGQTMPTLQIVERDYTAIADKLGAVGPLAEKLGFTVKDVTYELEHEVKRLVGDRRVVPLDDLEDRHRPAWDAGPPPTRASRRRDRRAAPSRRRCRASAARSPGPCGPRGGCAPFAENCCARRWKRSKSLLASHGGSIAGVKAWTNGCMSVEERSCFSYHVAAGRTMSDSSVVDVIRKSAESEQVELALGGLVAPPHLGRPRRRGVLAAHDVRWVPSRCLRKYSLPLAEEPMRFAAPEHQRARPVLRGVDVLDRRAEACRRAARSRRMRRGWPRCPRRPRPARPRRPAAGSRRTAGRTASSPAAPTARSCPPCACRPGGPRPEARRASRPSTRRCATGRCACTSTRCRSSCAAAASSRARWRGRSSR